MTATLKPFTAEAVLVGSGTATHIALLDEGVAFATYCGAENRGSRNSIRPVGVCDITCKRCAPKVTTR